MRFGRRASTCLSKSFARCVTLGIPYLVTHPGAHIGTGEEAGLERVAAGLDLRSWPGCRKWHVITCLEITAGQGSCLGHRLEHLATIIDLVKAPSAWASVSIPPTSSPPAMTSAAGSTPNSCKEIEVTVGSSA